MFSYTVLLCLLVGAVSGSSSSEENTVPPLRYDAPDDCQWWVRESGNGGVSGSDEVALSCKLRTINSEFDTTNFSVIPSEHTTSLKIECNDILMSKSSLDDRSFAHLTKLRELELDYCKLCLLYTSRCV